MPIVEPAGLIHRSIPLTTGITLHAVERPGEGTPVVCLHGIWSSWRHWLPLLPPGPGSFAGRPLLMVDQRGHGESGKPERGYALHDYVADAVALVDALGAARATFLGHSLGALTSLAAARAIPDRVESMLLEDPPLPLPADVSRLDPFWTTFAEALYGLFSIKHEPHAAVVAQLLEWTPDLPREVAEDIATSVIATADGVFTTIMGGTFGDGGLASSKPALSIPTLVFQAGSPEQRGLSDVGMAMIRAMVTDARLEVIPETGHSILPAAPAAYRAAVATFFGA